MGSLNPLYFYFPLWKAFSRLVPGIWRPVLFLFHEPKSMLLSSLPCFFMALIVLGEDEGL